jgi:hypothetical protein
VRFWSLFERTNFCDRGETFSLLIGCPFTIDSSCHPPTFLRFQGTIDLNIPFSKTTASVAAKVVISHIRIELGVSRSRAQLGLSSCMWLQMHGIRYALMGVAWKRYKLQIAVKQIRVGVKETKMGAFYSCSEEAKSAVLGLIEL